MSTKFSVRLMFAKNYSRKLSNAFKRFSDKERFQYSDKKNTTFLYLRDSEDYFINDLNKGCCGNIENICRSCPNKD
jgi:hypothetical protein